MAPSSLLRHSIAFSPHSPGNSFFKFSTFGASLNALVGQLGWLIASAR
jgi:hypothetical protein